MEAEVAMVDKNLDRLRWVDQIHRGRIMTRGIEPWRGDRGLASTPIWSSAPSSWPAAGRPWS